MTPKEIPGLELTGSNSAITSMQAILIPAAEEILGYRVGKLYAAHEPPSRWHEGIADTLDQQNDVTVP